MFKKVRRFTEVIIVMAVMNTPNFMLNELDTYCDEHDITGIKKVGVMIGSEVAGIGTALGLAILFDKLEN